MPLESPRWAQRTIKRSTTLYSKVEGHFGALLDDMCVEAFLLIRRKLVGEGGSGCEAREGTQEGQEGEEDQHGGERGVIGRWVACRDNRTSRIIVDSAVAVALVVEGSLTACRRFVAVGEDTHRKSKIGWLSVCAQATTGLANIECFYMIFHHTHTTVAVYMYCTSTEDMQHSCGCHAGLFHQYLPSYEPLRGGPDVSNTLTFCYVNAYLNWSRQAPGIPAA